MHFLFLSFITSSPSASCVSILCIKVGQRSECLKDFKLAKRKEDRRGLSFCLTTFCSGGWMGSRESGVSLALHVFQYQVCLNNHGFIHLQLRIINSLCITARCISPQASVSWGWGTCARTDVKPPKSKQQ